jgi:capsule polysaccharide export protein KpsE/RkpR
MEYHKTKDGRKIKLSQLETEHLRNIITRIERVARQGLLVRSGGGSCSEDIWYDEEIIRGKEALEKLNYDVYIKELYRRKELKKI